MWCGCVHSCCFVGAECNCKCDHHCQATALPKTDIIVAKVMSAVADIIVAKVMNAVTEIIVAKVMRVVTENSVVKVMSAVDDVNIIKVMRWYIMDVYH